MGVLHSEIQKYLLSHIIDLLMLGIKLRDPWTVPKELAPCFLHTLLFGRQHDKIVVKTQFKKFLRKG